MLTYLSMIDQDGRGYMSNTNKKYASNVVLPPPTLAPPTNDKENTKLLLDIQQKINGSPALNGGFDTLLYKVDKIEESQGKIVDRIDEIHESIYNPDKGLFARISAVKSLQDKEYNIIDKKIIELDIWKKQIDKENIEEKNYNKEFQKKVEDQQKIVVDQQKTIESLTKWKDSVSSFSKASVMGIGGSVMALAGKFLYDYVVFHWKLVYNHCMVESIFLREDIDRSIDIVSKKINEILFKVDNNILSSSNKIVTLLQLFHQISFDECQKRIFDTIINHAMMAEKLSPGSFRKTIELITNKNNRNYNSNFEGKKATKVDIITFVKSSNDKMLASLLIDALNLAGYGGKIIVEKSCTEKHSVELCRGYTFDICPAWPITIKLERPRTCVIDGYIENVSEIHHLLEIFAEKKESLLIFARGFSNDVINTLKVNYDRNTLKVIPVIVTFDLQGINTVNDISVVTGNDMVSSNKGDLINAIKYESCKYVDNVLIYVNKVTIQNSSTSHAVNIQVKNLRIKQFESNVEDVINLYSKRIRSLSPNHVIIRIPDDRDFIKKSQLIDNTFRSIRSIIDHGFCVSNDKIEPATINVISNTYAKKCIDVFQSIHVILC